MVGVISRVLLQCRREYQHLKRANVSEFGGYNCDKQTRGLV
jgi:hypothetical protein